MTSYPTFSLLTATTDVRWGFAEDWLRSVLDEARRGELPGLMRTGATFADAAAEYLRYVEHDRGRKPSTLRGYRSAIQAHLLRAFGELPVEARVSRFLSRPVLV